MSLTEEYDLNVNLRPVYPLAIREPSFFERSHPNWLRYTFTDMFRVAQFHDIPFGPPRPDPDRPECHHARNLRRAALYFPSYAAGVKRRRGAGKVSPFATKCLAVDLGRRSRTGTKETILRVPQRAPDWILRNWMRRPQAGCRSARRRNCRQPKRALEAAGHWGVPTLVFDGEPFFGQDRIEMAVWRMEQKGLDQAVMTTTHFFKTTDEVFKSPGRKSGARVVRSS